MKIELCNYVHKYTLFKHRKQHTLPCNKPLCNWSVTIAIVISEDTRNECIIKYYNMKDGHHDDK